MNKKNISNPQPLSEELNLEKDLRPSRIEEFIGQKQKISNLLTYIQGARSRKEQLDHVLLSGPPGLGKTTIATIIAREMGVKMRSTSGPVLEKKGDLTAILTDLGENEVLFIDEIHRLKKPLEEILYKAMEDFKVDVLIGQGAGARIISLEINPFTLIGATTRSGLLSAPLRDRFGINFHLDFYSVQDLTEIVLRSASVLKIEIDHQAAEIIASRSRGTPRIANRLLRRIRDFAQIKGNGKIDQQITFHAFQELEVDQFGLDEVDRKILLTIIDKFNGGPVGISTIAVALQQEQDTLEDVYEPFLIQAGFLKITSRGRVATEKAYEYFSRRQKQPTLF